ENLKHESESLLELCLPLLEHGWRRRHDDRLRLFSKEQLARYETCFDRLSKAGVVRDEEVDARQAQGLAQRLHLVRVNFDPSAKGRLEEIRIGCGHAVPAQGVEKGREPSRRVEALRRQVCPSFVLQDPTVDLVFPVHLQRLPLSVIIRTGEPNEWRLAWH